MMLAKSGPGDEPEGPAAGLGLLQDVGPGDVRGHQVGRELDPLEADVEDLGDRADHQRLGQPGHADQQDVAAGEDRRQDLLDHLALADDDLAQLGDHHVARVAELVEELGDPVAGGGHAVCRPLLGRRVLRRTGNVPRACRAVAPSRAPPGLTKRPG